MRPVLTDDPVTWSLCVSGTFMSPVKTSVRIDLPFCMGTRVDRSHIVVSGVRIGSREGGVPGESSTPIVKYGNTDVQIT